MTPLTPNFSVAMSGHRRRLIRRVAVVTSAVLLIGGTPLVAAALGSDDVAETTGDAAGSARGATALAPGSAPVSAPAASNRFPAWDASSLDVSLEPVAPPMPEPTPEPEPELSAVAAAVAAEEQAMAETLAVLVDTYAWDETGPQVIELQEALGVVADGRYTDATLGAHRGALDFVGLPTDDLPVAPVPVVPAGTTAEGWAALRNCESGGDYSVTNPSGKYRGAYQFDRSTWNSVAERNAPELVGLDPAGASPAEQDALAHALYNERGARPWPSCGRHL